MSIAIDALGRLVIPKAIRERAGIRPGVALEVRYRDGRVEIEPAPAPVVIEIVGGVAVARAVADEAPLTSEDVEDTRERLRAERA